jgi:hypothetical protein
MKIQLSKLHTYLKFEKNPELAERQFNMDFCQSVFKDIKKNGFKNPLVVCLRNDGDYDIVLGHNRYQCALRLEVTELDCIVTTKLEPKQLRLFKKQNYIVTQFDNDIK